MSDKGVKILLIEDNRDDIELTLRAFEKHKLVNEITVARDGEEALDILFQRGEDKARYFMPDLVLLDLKLPKVDGLEVIKQVKTNPATQAIPVVVLTSSKEEHDLVESYRLGVNSYIHKPVDFEEFTEVVSQLGLYWLLLNKVPRRRES